MTKFFAPTRWIWILMCFLVIASSRAEVKDGMFVFVPPSGSETKKGDSGCGGKICKTLREQIRRGCGTLGDNPYADTVLLRRRDTPKLPEGLNRSVILALASDDAVLAHEVLQPYLVGDDGLGRYIAGLYILIVRYRVGMPLTDQVAATAFGAMGKAVDEGLPLPVSDFEFYRALRELERGRTGLALRHLETATSMESRFFNALALTLRLRIAETTREQRRGDRRCMSAYTSLLEGAGKIMELEPCAQQAAHLDIYLRRSLRHPDQSPPYVAVLVYLSLISRRLDIAHSTVERFGELEGPHCRADVLHLLSNLLLAPNRP